MGVVIATAITACRDDGVVRPPSTGAKVVLAAQLESAGELVDIAFGYRRADSTRVVLGSQDFTVTGTGAQQFPVTIDITNCLQDSERQGAPNGGCPIVLDVVLRDQARAAIDSQTVGPLDARPGTTVPSPQPIVLRAPATLEVVAGDSQLGWVGQPLFDSIVVRLKDRSGTAIASKPLSVTAISGGGARAGSGAIVTDAQGEARIVYQLGSATGPQQFRVQTLGGNSISDTASAHGVAPWRERVGSGTLFSCALESNSAARCWGTGGGGALGNPAVTVDTGYPVPVVGAPPFVSLHVSSGSNTYHSNVCGLTSSGEVYCWGMNIANELGISATDTCTPFGVSLRPCNKTPTRVPTQLRFTAISVGGGDSSPSDSSLVSLARVCGIVASGEAYCWGSNGGGSVGDPNLTAAFTSAPTLVSGGHKFVHVSTGQRSTCGVTNRRVVMCWGSNITGQLGDGTVVARPAPAPVTSTQQFHSVDVGAWAACALTVAGDAYCWGLDEPSLRYGGFGNSHTPVRTALPTSLQRLNLGWSHACGTSALGVAYCWGITRDGVLGNGIITPEGVEPNPQLVLGGHAFEEISAGLLNTCGRTVAGRVYCWGTSDLGALGTGVVRGIGISQPVPVNFTGVPSTQPPAALSYGTFLRRFAAGQTVFALVLALDAAGNPLPGIPLQFSVLSGGGAINATATTAANGVAIVTGTLGAQPGTNVFLARVAALPTITLSLSVDGLAPGAPAKLVAFNPIFAVAGGPPVTLSFSRVDVSDLTGLAVRGVPVTFTLQRPGTVRLMPPNTLPTTILSDNNGSATLPASAGWVPDTVARNDTVLVTSSLLPGVQAILNLRTAPATVTRLSFASTPSTVRAGEVTSIGVVALDRYNNRSGAGPPTVTISIASAPVGASAGGVLTRGPDFTVPGAVYTFGGITFSVPGTYRLQAAASGLPTVVSAAITVTP